MRTQCSVIGRDQAIRAGLTPKAIVRALGSGSLVEVHAGVYAPASSPDTLLRRYMAAVLWAGPAAAVSHRSAAAHLGLHGFGPGIVEVTTTRRCLKADGVIVHHSRCFGSRDIHRLDGIPFTTAARTLIDLPSVARLDRVESALDTALVKGYVSPAYLWKEMNRVGTAGRRNTAPLRQWVVERMGDSRPSASTSETRLFQLFRTSGLRGHQKQFEVVDSEGVMFIDYAFPEVMLAIELDSWEWHLGRAARKRDARRQKRLERLGWTILRFFWEDVMFDPDYVMGEIVTTLEALRRRGVQVSSPHRASNLHTSASKLSRA